MQNPQDFLDPAGNQNNLDAIWQFLRTLRHDLNLNMTAMGHMAYNMTIVHNNIREVDNGLNTVANAARAYADNHNQRMDHLENMITEIRDLVVQAQEFNQGIGARFDGLDERINNHQLMINDGNAGRVELRQDVQTLNQAQVEADQRFRGFREDYTRTLSATQYNRISRSFRLAPSYHNQPLPILSLKNWDHLNHPANIHTLTEDQLDRLGEHYGMMLPNDRARKME